MGGHASTLAAVPCFPNDIVGIYRTWAEYTIAVAPTKVCADLGGTLVNDNTACAVDFTGLIPERWNLKPDFACENAGGTVHDASVCIVEFGVLPSEVTKEARNKYCGGIGGVWKNEGCGEYACKA